MGLEKVGLKVIFKLTFTLGFLISDGNEFQIYGAQCLNAFSLHFLLALGGIFNRF